MILKCALDFSANRPMKRFSEGLILTHITCNSQKGKQLDLKRAKILPGETRLVITCFCSLL